MVMSSLRKLREDPHLTLREQVI